ncbi:hypothetical protein ABT237_11380 [Streptomyces sp. NPDC001581]|uniref:hypothetical protein n=1 Tax=Streptomyces sp. NPDC001581 TaxID=3154386 RepID=UPI0033184185
MTWEHVEHISTTLSVVNTLGALGYQSWAVSLRRQLDRLKPQTTAMQAPPATEQACPRRVRAVIHVTASDGHVVTVTLDHACAASEPSEVTSRW